MEDKDILVRFIQCVENNTKAIDKMSDVMQVVINNNNAVIDNLGKLNKFATETYSRFNNMLMVVDAMSICMFEKNVIDEGRFQEVMEQLTAQHEQRIKEENHECNGECKHETEGKADSAGIKA
jgi:5'-3' exonuclease